MDIPNLFHNAAGAVPDIETLADDFSGFLVLGGTQEDIRELPTDIDLYQDHDARNESRETDPTTGLYLAMEWGLIPDWFNSRRHWLGYMTKNRPGLWEIVTWMLNMLYLPSLSGRNEEGHLHIDTTEASLFIEDFNSINDVVLEICTGYYPILGPAERPETFDPKIILQGFRSPHEAYAVFASLKRAVRERIGFLRWYLAAVPERDAVLSSQLYHDLLRWSFPAIESIGYVVDLRRQWRQINLALWIRSDVRVFFRWTDHESEDPKFSRVNPFLIAADTGVDGHRNPRFCVEFNSDLEKACRDSWRYDDFLQPIIPEVHLPLVGDNDINHCEFGIIDFQGWRRHCLPKDLSPEECIHRFQFTEKLASDSKTWITTFCRWMSREPYKVNSKPNGPTSIDYENLMVLRELTRIQNSPHRDRAFNIANGQPESPRDCPEAAFRIIKPVVKRQLEQEIKTAPHLESVADASGDRDVPTGE